MIQLKNCIKEKIYFTNNVKEFIDLLFSTINNDEIQKYWIENILDIDSIYDDKKIKKLRVIIKFKNDIKNYGLIYNFFNKESHYFNTPDMKNNNNKILLISPNEINDDFLHQKIINLDGYLYYKNIDSEIDKIYLLNYKNCFKLNK